jgi:PAS domain S-box-containing protein
MHAPTILSVLAAAIYAMLAVYPLATGPATRAGRNFLALTLLLAICSAAHALAFNAPDATVAWRWFVVGTVAWALFTPICLLLPLELVRGRALPWWVVGALAIPGLGAMIVTLGVDAGPASLVLTPRGWARDLSARPALWNAVSAVLFGYVLAALGVIAWWWRRARTRRERRQAAWLLGSGLLGVAGALLFQLAHPVSETPGLPRVNHIYGVVWAAGYAVAIFRHRLMAPSASLAANAILAGIQDLVFVVADDGRILEANSRARALLGGDAERSRDLPIQDLFHPPEAISEAVDRARGADPTPAWRDATMTVSEGHPVPVAFMVSPIRDDFGDRLGFAVVAQDQRPMMEALKAERIASIGLLAGGIAHDFNNLLTAIGGYIDLARADMDAGSPADRRLVEASRACDRAQGLTQQLLTFSRGGAPVRRATSLVDILDDTAAFATSGSRVRAEVHVPDGLWLVDADAGQIAQVVHNLALNAVQAMPEGGTLTITAANVASGSPGLDGAPLDTARVRLTVADEGVGIAPEVLPRVCEPFFTTKPEGSGLGLATCWSVVRRHEGEMVIDSRPGRGTRVRIDLPRAKRGTGETPVPPCRAMATGGRALVMDDQPQVEAVARDMLVALGWDVVGTADGDAAVRAFLEAEAAGRPFDLLLLDLTVPGGAGGVDAIRRIRERRDTVYAVVSSGYGEEEVMAAPSVHGFDDVLPKPYSCEGMREMIARFERRRARAAAPGQPISV